MAQVQKLAYTIEELCEVFGTNRTRIYSMINDGTLKTFKNGRRRQATHQAAQEALAKLERDSEKGRAAA